jgi:hypothetical protein
MRQSISSTVEATVRPQKCVHDLAKPGKVGEIGDFDEVVDYVGLSFDASKQDILKAKRSILRAILVGFNGWSKDPPIKEMVDRSSGNPTPATQDAPQTENPANFRP